MGSLFENQTNYLESVNMDNCIEMVIVFLDIIHVDI